MSMPVSSFLIWLTISLHSIIICFTSFTYMAVNAIQHENWPAINAVRAAWLEVEHMPGNFQSLKPIPSFQGHSMHVDSWKESPSKRSQVAYLRIFWPLSLMTIKYQLAWGRFSFPDRLEVVRALVGQQLIRRGVDQRDLETRCIQTSLQR